MSEDTNTTLTLDRAELLKAAGAGVLVVSFAAPLAELADAATERAAGPWPDVSTRSLDSWIAVNADGTVTLFSGKNDNGQGVETAFRQIVAEELDLDLEQVKAVVGDSSRTLDQGGASSSTAISNGAVALRNAAAEGRRVLVELAAQRLGVPASGLTVEKGVVLVAADRARRATYGELLGNQKFNVTIQSNNSLGNNLTAVGVAKPKDPATYKLVGKSIQRPEIARMVYGRQVWPGDIRVPGMVHARVVRPKAAGAKVVGVNGFPKRIPTLVGVLPMGADAVAVFARREEDAINAAKTLRVRWRNPALAPFSTHETVYDYIRQARPRFDRVVTNTGDIGKALGSAAKVIEAEYLWPFQSHASMAPACAVADYRADGTITVWSGTQKTHRVQRGVAQLLGMDTSSVKVLYVQGPGSYGRNDADDVALEAAWLSKQIRKPVRLQWMRNEGTGWDPKGPATIIRMRGGLDAAGEALGWDYDWKGFSGQEVGTSGEQAADTLIGMSMGFVRPQRNTAGAPEESYGFPHKRIRQQVVEAFLPMNNPLRSAHLRDPQGPQSTFASESFVDELAYAAGVDPVQFRLKYLTDPKHAAVVKAAADAWKWKPGRAASNVSKTAAVLRGRGIAYAERGPTIVAIISEVEVTRKTGKVWVKRALVAADAGLIINPDGFRNVMEANYVQTASRTLKEEVRFSRTGVTSIDWETYPIMNASEVPERVDVVTVNNVPGAAPGAAGEPPTRPVAASIANAIFDATGVRLRHVPFTPTRVRAALKAAGL
jgi:nicotinate dehydrogenase subunit B